MTKSKLLLSTISILFFGFVAFSPVSQAQCLEGPGVIWKSPGFQITIGDLAGFCAPVLWFSPDEPNLLDSEGKPQLPENLAYDTEGSSPVVYYKLRNIYADRDNKALYKSSERIEDWVIDLREVRAMDLEYYMYYERELGLGGHPHDLESVAFQLQVIHNPYCPEAAYLVQVRKVIARAHGLSWFENALRIDYNTTFPMTILVEEGKHANCTDRNGDGVYTPGFDVTEKVNDAWGVRDIISSGKLFSGGFQAWMAKTRTDRSKVLPPLPPESPHYKMFIEHHNELIVNYTYELRSFPDILEQVEDKNFRKMIKSKKPVEWPKMIHVSGDGSILQWSKENKPHKAVGISYRHDEVGTLAFSVPLLLFKNVQAPLTGGWIYNRFYLGSKENINPRMTRSFGHQIVHSNSASRWLDTYIGLGYEFHDTDLNPEDVRTQSFFVSEIGLKIRVNMINSPFKFLRFLGTEYWGLRLGWKNVGFSPFQSSGFVLEFGAGVF